MRNYQNYQDIYSDTAKDIMKIAEEIEQEQENIEPDSQKIQKLVYKQLMTGLNMNINTRRNYNVF